MFTFAWNILIQKNTKKLSLQPNITIKIFLKTGTAIASQCIFLNRWCGTRIERHKYIVRQKTGPVFWSSAANATK